MIAARYAAALVVLIIAVGNLYGATVGGASPLVCPSAPIRSYMDITVDSKNALLSPMVYEISGNYEKKPIQSALVYRIKLGTGSNPNEVCYGATDSSGVAKFAYNPNVNGCLDYWFIFCPTGDLTTKWKRQMCLNGTGLPRNAIDTDPIPRCDTGTAVPQPRTEYLLSHNEFYFCNYPPDDFAPLCWPLMLIFGLLLGASFAAGKNPFAAFDFSSPRLSRGRHYTTRMQQKRFDLLGMLYGANAAVDVGTRVGETVSNLKQGKSLSESVSRAKGWSALGWLGGQITQFVSKTLGLGEKKQDDNNMEKGTKDQKEKLDGSKHVKPYETLSYQKEETSTKVNQVNKTVDNKDNPKDNPQKRDVGKNLKEGKSGDKPPPVASNAKNVSNMANNFLMAIWGLIKFIFTGERERTDSEKQYTNNINQIGLELAGTAAKEGWGNFRFVMAFLWEIIKLNIRMRTTDPQSGKKIWDEILFKSFMNALLSQTRFVGNSGIRHFMEGAYFATNPDALPIGLRETLGTLIKVGWLDFKAAIYAKDANGNKLVGDFFILDKNRIARKLTDAGGDFYQIINITTGAVEYARQDANGNWVSTAYDKNGVRQGEWNQPLADETKNLLTNPGTWAEKNRTWCIYTLDDKGNWSYKLVSRDDFERIKNSDASFNRAIGELDYMRAGQKQFTQWERDNAPVASTLYDYLYNRAVFGLTLVPDEKGTLPGVSNDFKISAEDMKLIKEFALNNNLGVLTGKLNGNGIAGAILVFDLILAATDKKYQDIVSKGTQQDRINYIIGKIKTEDGVENMLGNANKLLELHRDMQEYNYWMRMGNVRMNYANRLDRTSAENYNSEAWKLELDRYAIDAAIGAKVAFETANIFMNAINSIRNMTDEERKEYALEINKKVSDFEKKFEGIDLKNFSVQDYSRLTDEQREYVRLKVEQQVLNELVGVGGRRDLKSSLIENGTFLSNSIHTVVKQYDIEYGFYSVASMMTAPDFWKAGSVDLIALVYANINGIKADPTVETKFLQQVAEICSFDLDQYKYFKKNELQAARETLVKYYEAYLLDPTNPDKKAAFVGALVATQEAFSGIMISSQMDAGLAGNKNANQYLLNAGKERTDLNPLDNEDFIKKFGKPGEPPKELVDDGGVLNQEAAQYIAEKNYALNRNYYNAINNIIANDAYERDFMNQFNMKEINSAWNVFASTFNGDTHAKIDVGRKLFAEIEITGQGNNTFSIMKQTYDKAYYYTDYYRQQVKTEMKDVLYGPAYLTDYDAVINDQLWARRHEIMNNPLITNIKGGIVSENLRESREELQEIIDKHNFLKKIGLDDNYVYYSNIWERVRQSLPTNVYQEWKKNFYGIPEDDRLKYLDMSNKVVDDYLTLSFSFGSLNMETFQKTNKKLEIIQNPENILNYKHD